MTTWRDELRPASFRGVPFEVTSSVATFGRRIVEREYPQRDRPSSEDLGRAARPFKVSAFVIGPDYRRRRDALIRALEQPGPGVLIHPYFGTLSVVARPAEVTESTADGGFASFALEFVEAGDLIFPTVAADSGSLTAAAATATNAAAGAEFAAKFTIKSAPPFVAAAAAASLAGRLATVRQAIRSPAAGVVAGIGAALDALTAIELQSGLLLAEPAKLAAALQTAFAQVESLVALEPLAAAAGLASTTESTVAGQQISDNDVALGRVMTRAALAAQAGVAARTAFATYDDAVKFRDGFADNCNAESGVADGAAFESLVDLRSAVVDDVTARAADLAVLKTFEPIGVLSSLELAQRLYGDATRADEIVARNGIVHPGFIGGPVLVLSQ